MNRCLDCQFLSKLTNILATDESIPAPWSVNERKQGHLRCGSIPMCAHGVWDTRIDPDLDAELEVNKQRGNSCYFLEVHKGMSFTAGRDLLKRRSEIARTRRERWTLGLSIVALLVSAIAVVVNITMR